MTFQNLLLVFFGSGLGGCLRYGISLSVQGITRSGFPYGTLLVNFLACWLAAFFVHRMGNLATNDSTLRILILSGFCGGFSTFSTFSLENAGLIQKGLWGQALLYSLLSLASGIMVFFFYVPSQGRF